MIDLHCHILPGVDDGALDMADSLAMARQAEADGITAVCATPHIRHDHDVRIAELPERLAALNRALAAAALTTRVLPGGEVAETIVERLGDEELRIVTLGGAGAWILLEPRPGPLSDSLAATVVALRRRLRCVIAHRGSCLAVPIMLGDVAWGELWAGARTCTVRRCARPR